MRVFLSGKMILFLYLCAEVLRGKRTNERKSVYSVGGSGMEQKGGYGNI